LSYGPRIGPTVHTGGRYADFRKLIALENGKRKNIKPKGGVETIDRRSAWSAIAGKYFTLIVIPDATTTPRSTRRRWKQQPVLSSLALSRPVVKGAGSKTCSCLLRTKSSKELSGTTTLKNAFGRTGEQAGRSAGRRQLSGGWKPS
jgi:hypothetical protein